VPRFEVAVAEVRALADSLDGQMWKCAPISEDEVWDAYRAGEIEDRSWGEVINTLNEEDARAFHVRRIATLMREPDLGLMILVLENHQHPFVAYFNDGNHRFAAASVRGDSTVRLVIAASAEANIPASLPSARPIP
jgi:hypothetical protein